MSNESHLRKLTKVNEKAHNIRKGVLSSEEKNNMSALQNMVMT